MKLMIMACSIIIRSHRIAFYLAFLVFFAYSFFLQVLFIVLEHFLRSVGAAVWRLG